MKDSICPANEVITSYLTNILNINVLLVSLGLILLFWIIKEYDRKIKNKWWLWLILFSILLGIVSIILNLIIYREFIDLITRTTLAGEAEFQPLANLKIIFYLDILIIILLLIGFFGLRHEKI
ncbi:MAG: hypothetical protein H0U70_01615 [Tatlockia sp.]|nr:hypothetical protein [Tatlockia sp.]